MGVGNYLKAKKEGVEIVLADPSKSHLAGLMLAREDKVAGEELLDEINAKLKGEGGIQVEGAGKASLTDIMSEGGEGVLEIVDYAVR